MDVTTLMKLVGSTGSTDTISRMTGMSAEQVSSVLTNVMPMLLQGAGNQANDAATAESFSNALETHGAADTSDLSRFLGGVDLADGAKIVSHLLGGKQEASVQEAAKASGVSAKDVTKVLTLVAPLLLTILGQQKKKHGSAGSALLQAVMAGTAAKAFGASDVLGLLGKLMK